LKATPVLPAHLAPLLRAQAYPHPVTGIQLVETHISWVLLTGEYAYKLKRPVSYPFVDLRSPQRRAFLCAEEVRLNRRFAPDLYLGVCAIVARGGGLRVGGDGPPVEHAVCMRQFDRDDELDRLIETGRVDATELEAFGRELADIHARLPRVAPSERWGTFESVSAQLRGNLAECRELAARPGTAAAVEAVAHALDSQLRALAPGIAARREQHVRECHGDLHARNLVRWQGRLMAFDCLEFEPAFRWIDVADEVAFLWMDLAARHRPDLAQAFLRGYLERGGDFELCRLLRLYGCHRALVRAKVAALEAGATAGAQSTLLAQHRQYLECARDLVAPGAPRLVLMSGLSGSGKTWLARQLAPTLGAIHVRSDLERKRLAGLPETADSHSAVGGGLYSSESSDQVYEHLARCAEAALAGGLSVLVDATFARRAERNRFAALAQRRDCDLVVVHCDAPLPVLQARIARRQCARDASEANLDVLAWQRAHAEPIAADEGLRVVEADTTGAAVVSDVLAALGNT
jgi:aminoglycoside phosphotransferase family enzyme/predicted kinase